MSSMLVNILLFAAFIAAVIPVAWLCNRLAMKLERRKAKLAKNPHKHEGEGDGN